MKTGPAMLLLSLTIFIGSLCLLPPVSRFEDTSDDLIVGSLNFSRSQPKPVPYMVRRDERISPDLKPYPSQYGITYHLLLPFERHLDLARLPFLLSLAFAALTAVAFWWFSRGLGGPDREIEGSIFLILCCLSPTFLMFSGSFYWQLPVLLAPFLLTYRLGHQRPLLAVSLVVPCLLLRFMGGYEYTSTLVLSPIAALLLRFAFDEVSPKRALLTSIALGVAGGMSFLLALGFHVWTLKLLHGDWESAVQALSGVVTYRTSGDYFGHEISLRNDVIILISSFFRNEVLLVVGLALITCLISFVVKGRAATVRLAGALAFALLAGLSWQVLARGHMRDHAHINFIVYMIPFGLCVYLAFSRIVSACLARQIH